MGLPRETQLEEGGNLDPTLGLDEAPDRPIALRKDATLGGTYRIVRRLGQGGMGTVYVVEHTGLHKRFAAKVVSKVLKESAIKRLLNEAKITSAIDHPNIVEVVNLGREADGSVFVIMELLEGEDLGRRLERQADDEERPWLPDEQLIAYVPQILDGLAAAHAAGIIHRDLKPENVFLACKEDGRTAVKLLDFGIAKNVEPEEDHKLTRTGQIIGTPLYMAPEQARNMSDADVRSDIYSIGVLLYEMATGAPPFEADTLFDLIVQHATQPPVAPTARRKELPGPIEAVILRCLEKAPEDRFESVAALRDAWNAAWLGVPPEPLARAGVHSDELSLDEEEPEAVLRAPGAAEEIARVVRPRTGLIAAVAVAALVIGGGAAWALTDSADESDGDRAAELAEAPPPLEDAPTDGELGPAGPAAPTLSETRVLQTSPSGATVTRGDEVLGQTPIDVAYPEGGRVEVTVSLEGYVTQTVEIGDGPTPLVEVDLARIRRAHPRRGRPSRPPTQAENAPAAPAPAPPAAEPAPRSSGSMLLGMDQFDSERGQ